MVYRQFYFPRKSSKNPRKYFGKCRRGLKSLTFYPKGWKVLLFIPRDDMYYFLSLYNGAGNSLWMLEFMCIFTQDLMMCFGRAMRVFVLPPPPSVPLPSSPPLAEQKPSLHRQNTLFTKDHSYKNFQPLLKFVQNEKIWNINLDV